MKKALLNAGLLTAMLLAVSACNDDGGGGGAQFQFGQTFATIFGSGPNVTADPSAVQDGDAGQLSLTTDPVAVQ